MRRALPLALALVALAAAAPPAAAVRVIGTNGTSLTRYDTVASDQTTSAIAGMQPGESLVSLDFRPSNGKLYGIGTTSRVYQINPFTAQAGAEGFVGFSLNGTAWGGDFSPVADRLRSVSNTEQNLRINADDGSLVASDAPLNGPAGEVAPNPNIVAAAYSNNFAGAPSTTLYAIDSLFGRLRVVDPPNTGTVIDVGSLGVGTGLNQDIGFDIGTDGLAYATISTGSPAVTRLYRIDLATGAATVVKSTGTGPQLGLAVVPSPLRLSASTDTVQEGETVVFTVVREGPGIGQVGVSYAAAGGSAAADDFAPTTGTLTWDFDDAGARTFSVTIPDDATPEGPETFTLNLSDPTGGAGIVSDASLPITIAASDPAPPDPGGGDPTPPVTPPTTPPDTRAPALLVGGSASQKLATARSKGVSVAVTTDEACLLKLEALLSKSVAKKLGISRRVAASASIAQVGAGTLRLALTDRASRALRSQRKVALTVSATCQDVPGNRSAAVTHKVTLKR